LQVAKKEWPTGSLILEHNRRKIEEMRLFEDDPKFAKIIRAFRQQIAQDSYELSLMEGQN